MAKPAPFDWADPLNLTALLTEDERMIYDSATAFAAAELAPIVRRVYQTVDAGLAFEPDVVVIIDSPEFTHPIAKRTRQRSTASLSAVCRPF